MTITKNFFQIFSKKIKKIFSTFSFLLYEQKQVVFFCFTSQKKQDRKHVKSWKKKL